MSYGVTDIGFVKKTQAEIQSEREAEYKAALGADIDISPYSPFGLIIGLESKREYDLYEKLENQYYGLYIDSAEGVQLDRAVAIRGVSRIPEARATVELTFTGTTGAVVPVGTICSYQNISFITTESGTLIAGTVTLTARAINAGVDGNVLAGTITLINTAISGVTAVTNAAAASGGRVAETDAELRVRYKLPNSDGGASAPAIQAVFTSLDGVLSCSVLENNTDTATATMTPHSIRVVIEGATSDQVFDTLLKYKPAGIETIGGTTVSGTDNEGVARSYKYDTPSDVDIYCDIDLTIDTVAYGDTAAAWKTEYQAQVITNIIETIGGNYGGTDYPGLGVGVDVEAWKVIASMTNLPYIQGQIVVKVDTVVSPALDRVDIGVDERAKAASARIAVTTA